MTRKNSHARRQSRRDQHEPRIHIPHSSWNRAASARGGNTLIAPDDFWARLGL